MKKIILMSLVFVVFYGCGAIFNSEQDVTFRSNVPGALVSVNGQEMCTTPCQVNIETSKQSLLVKAEKDGFKPADGVIGTAIAPKALLLNFVGGLFLVGGGLVSTTVDLATGHMYQYEPNHYFFELVPAGVPSGVTMDDSLHFTVRNIDLLRADAANGGGEYIQALADMLGAPVGELIDLFNNETDNDKILDTIAEY